MPELIILGTSSMVPTKERNVQAFYLEFEGEGILFDCGEGTQRQLNIAGVSRAKIKKIFISHWHGDHVGGLIGLIQTMGNSNFEGVLNVYGPEGTKEHMFHIMNATIFENKIDIRVHDLSPKRDELLPFVETDKYIVSCMPVAHSVPCLGYAWKEKDKVRVDMGTCKKMGLDDKDPKTAPLIGKLSRGQKVMFNGKEITPDDVTYRAAGKKLAVIPDTHVHPNLAVLAQHADIVICEATYANEEEEKALEYRHLTAEMAAHVAAEADAKRLIITHFSQRYTSISRHVEEARTVFPNTDAAFDLMKVTF